MKLQNCGHVNHATLQTVVVQSSSSGAQRIDLVNAYKRQWVPIIRNKEVGRKKKWGKMNRHQKAGATK